MQTRTIIARFRGRCCKCGGAILAGYPMEWGGAGRSKHTKCPAFGIVHEAPERRWAVRSSGQAPAKAPAGARPHIQKP